MTAAYDAIAEGYDARMPGSDWIRARLWDHFARHLAPDARVLDAGCGTGIDTAWLAARGAEVLAVDASAGMLAELRRRVDSPRVHVRQLDLDALGELAEPGQGPHDGRYDGIISSFAAVNTVRDPAAFGRACARLVRPGGVVILHALGRLPLWRLAGLLRRGALGEALADVRDPVRLVPIGPAVVPHARATARGFYIAALSPAFTLVHAEAVGVLRPPYPSPRVPPRVLAALAAAEARVAALPGLRDAGDQWILVARRVPPADRGPGRPPPPGAQTGYATPP